jgi:hypothetical protein
MAAERTAEAGWAAASQTAESATGRDNCEFPVIRARCVPELLGQTKK